jgi:hypothetical protein
LQALPPHHCQGEVRRTSQARTSQAPSQLGDAAAQLRALPHRAAIGPIRPTGPSLTISPIRPIRPTIPPNP